MNKIICKTILIGLFITTAVIFTKCYKEKKKELERLKRSLNEATYSEIQVSQCF